MRKYINLISQSIISKVYTDRKDSIVKVVFKNKDGKSEEKILSGQAIADSLNQLVNIRNHNMAISENIKQGIIKDIEGIHKKNDRYVYKAPDLSAKKQYNELFENEQAVQFYLNNLIPGSISKIAQLKDRFEEILGFDPKEGLCHSLNYFITFMQLKNRKDFVGFLKSGNIIHEQDFIGYIDGRKEQTIELLTMQCLLQFLPIFDVQSIKRREENPLYSNGQIYHKFCKDLLSINERVPTNQKEIEGILNDVKIGCYLEFTLSCYAYNNNESDNDDEKSIEHSMLVYKAENGKYIFFDPDEGVVGFCPNTGVANFTVEEVSRVIELAVNYYSHNLFVESDKDYCAPYITLKNATLVLKKAEKFYETTERTNSKIIDISVDKGINKLLLTPASL